MAERRWCVHGARALKTKNSITIMKSFKVLIVTAVTAATIGIVGSQSAHAGGVYVNGNGGGAVVRTGPAPRYYAPHTTTVKHNDNKDTVKVCREYYYGTKNCAKWSY